MTGGFLVIDKVAPALSAVSKPVVFSRPVLYNADNKYRLGLAPGPKGV